MPNIRMKNVFNLIERYASLLTYNLTYDTSISMLPWGGPQRREGVLMG